MKRQSQITEVSLVRAESMWPDNPTCVGKFVATGVMALTRTDDGRKFDLGDPIRTSLLVKVDIEAGTIETLNTIYKIV